jgi:hypothetical protein
MKQLTDMDPTVRQYLEEIASPRVPDYFERMVGRSARTRQRPAWLVGSWWVSRSPVAASGPAMQRALVLALAALLAIALIGAGVVGSQLVRGDRPLADLQAVATLPWQPRPLLPAPSLLSWLDEACTAEIRRQYDPAATPHRWLVDVRGGGYIMAWYGADQPFTWPSRESGYCYAKVLPGRAPEVLQMTWSPPGTMRPPEGVVLRPQLQGENTDLGGPGPPALSGPLPSFVPVPLSHVAGHVAPEVERVEAILATGERVEASVSGTAYALWLPALRNGQEVSFQRIVAYEAFGADGRTLAVVPAPTPDP